MGTHAGVTLFHSNTPTSLRKETMKLPDKRVMAEASARTESTRTAVGVGATASVVATTPARLKPQVATPGATKWKAQALTYGNAHCVIRHSQRHFSGAT